MSDIHRLEQKIDDHIGSQSQSNARVERSLEKIAESMATFLGFQARAEERHLADSKWRESVEKHQDKQDEKIEQQAKDFERFKDTEFQDVRDGQKKNSLIVNGALIVVSSLISVFATWLVMGG